LGLAIVKRYADLLGHPLALYSKPGVGTMFSVTVTYGQEQQLAARELVDALENPAFGVTLLFGVSGSGKTEVYIRAMRAALAQGKQAIFLVPEIALTTQLMQRLAARFDNVALIHSGLSDIQRSAMWEEIASGERNVIIGTRSAVFAPCRQLGIIIVDEEQEGSFKNLQTPRFHVRDVAIARALQLQIPVVLGSATPSIEVWHRSDSHPNYRRLRLSQRVKGLPMPRVTTVDMRNELTDKEKTPVLSQAMQRMLRKTYEEGEQSILLINRRGFAQRLHCPGCRSRIECPHCHAGYVDHAVGGFAMCHFCRNRIELPTICPNITCGQRLIRVGAGTQKAEEYIQRLLPDARVARADSDTMTRQADYQKLVSDLNSREVDVLVGTQMIAKGLDFPHVSFVGVLQAEPAAMGADFRAQERLFQLVTQVAGRAGRSEKPGSVVIQTSMPELPAIQYAIHHDYENFVKVELETRRKVGWPPFSRLARVVLAHPQESAAKQEAERMVGQITEIAAGLPDLHADCIGPSPCAVTRIRNLYRYDFIIRCPDVGRLRTFLAEIEKRNALRSKAKSFQIDVDPVSLT
ncbi:MAG: replication restart helicase PriA, partial [Phycisphaerae bacterium]